MVLDPIPQSLPVHFFGSRPQPPTSWESKKGRQERQGGREVFLLTGREGERGETKRERERKPGRALSHSLHMYVYTHTHRTHIQLQIVFVTFVCVCTRVCVCGVLTLPVSHTHTRTHAHRANKNTNVTALGCLIRDIFLIRVTWLTNHWYDVTHSSVTRLMYRSWHNSRLCDMTLHHSCDMTHSSAIWLTHRSWHNSRSRDMTHASFMWHDVSISDMTHASFVTQFTLSQCVKSFSMHTLWAHRQLYAQTSIHCALLLSHDVPLRNILLYARSMNA